MSFAESIAEVAAGTRRWHLEHADNLDVLPLCPDEFFDSIVTDAPYGLSDFDPDMLEVIQHWLAGDDAKVQHRKGFMGKSWDSFVPGPATWRECFRVLKPGAHMLVFGSTRTYDMLTLAIRLAGFEIRDSIDWVYGSGMPKSMNVAKAIDRELGKPRNVHGKGEAVNRIALDYGGATGKAKNGLKAHYERDDVSRTEEAKAWEGWGTTLKPAREPIVVARKPFKGTVARNVLKYGTGALNIDACKVSFANRADEEESKAKNQHADFGTSSPITVNSYGDYGTERPNYNATGRWPANLILTHGPGCKPCGARAIRSTGHYPSSRPAGSQISGATGHVGQTGLEERHTDGEIVESWECQPGCPVAELDRQSGITSVTGKRSEQSRNAVVEGTTWGTNNHRSVEYQDTGGASRFFNVFAFDADDLETAAFIYLAKAGRQDREAGCEGMAVTGRQTKEGSELPGFKCRRCDRWKVSTNPCVCIEPEFVPVPLEARPVANNHPTLKSTELCEHLCKLGTPPNGIVLDLFAGSGSTGRGAMRGGYRFVGIEREDTEEEPYATIARRRIAHAEEEARAAAAAPKQASLFEPEPPRAKPARPVQRGLFDE